jgi:hypothetical protein
MVAGREARDPRAEEFAPEGISAAGALCVGWPLLLYRDNALYVWNE